MRELSGALAPGGTDVTSARRGRAESRREHHRRLQIEHYHECLDMLRTVVPRHPLVRRLADELVDCPLAHARTQA